MDPQVFNQAVAALDAKVPTLTDAEFNVGLAALAAMAGDEHTDIVPVTPAIGASQSFPLVFRWLDDGVFVSSAAAEYSKALGTQLVRVGKTPIDDVMQLLGTLTSLTFRTLAGQEFTLDVVPNGTAPLVSAIAAAQGPVPLYLQNTNLNYWFTYLAPLRLLYFKYNRCQEMAGSTATLLTK
ncbi:MAG TPA: hypothetical protein VGH38_34265, partial [Bryobacteraceae bacterium]